MLRRLILASLIVLASASTAAADEGQTYATRVSPIFVEGGLQACSITFDVVRQDAEYTRNEPVQVSGSLTYWAMPGKADAVSLKLGTSSLGSTGGPIAPTAAYLVSEFGTNAGDLAGSQMSDTPGFRVFAFNVAENTVKALMPAFDPGVIRFAYALSGGATGAITAVDLNVSAVDDRQQIIDGKSRTAWAACIQTLLKLGTDRQ